MLIADLMLYLRQTFVYVEMQSQACPWVFCMLDFYDGVKQKLLIMHQTGTEMQLAGGSESILMMWLVFV